MRTRWATTMTTKATEPSSTSEPISSGYVLIQRDRLVNTTTLEDEPWKREHLDRVPRQDGHPVARPRFDPSRRKYGEHEVGALSLPRRSSDPSPQRPFQKPSAGLCSPFPPPPGGTPDPGGQGLLATCRLDRFLTWRRLRPDRRRSAPPHRRPCHGRTPMGHQPRVASTR